MRSGPATLLLCAFLLIAGACASGSSSRSPAGVYQFEKEAIVLRLKADPKLNLHDRVPHTLLVCVYQLQDPNAFNQLLMDSREISKLLECTRFDPGVANARRLVLQPGQEMTDVLDRSEGARYLGIVAGYFQLEKSRASRIVPIAMGGLFRKRPKKMDLEVFLGPEEILGMKETP